MAQDTGKYRNTKDQFYTRPEVAKACVESIQKLGFEGEWVEPSAGGGAFLDLVPHATGYDIEPKHPRVTKADFLTVDLPDRCIVFGNPPFGRQSSLAKKFIRHAASKAGVIAFVLPRSFSKPSMQACFPAHFHLVHEEDIPKNAFVVNGAPYDVPCVFQIWQRKDVPRPKAETIDPAGFQFVKKTDAHDIAFRRVGGNAGKCSFPADQSIQSHYFVKLDDPTLAKRIVEKSQLHVFPTNTTGPRSLSKSEAIRFLNACTTSPAG